MSDQKNKYSFYVYDMTDLCLHTVMKVADCILPPNTPLIDSCAKFFSWKLIRFALKLQTITAWTTHVEVSPSGLRYLMRFIFQPLEISFLLVCLPCLSLQDTDMCLQSHSYLLFAGCYLSLSDPAWTCSAVSFFLKCFLEIFLEALMLQFHAGSDKTAEQFIKV